MAASLGTAAALTLWMWWVVLARFHAQLVPAADLEELPEEGGGAAMGKQHARRGNALPPNGGGGAPVPAASRRSVLASLKGRVERLMGEHEAYVAFARDPLFVKQYGALFDGYVPGRRWFLVVELCTAWAGGVLSGVAAAGGGADTDCAALELLNLALNAAVLCSVAALPYRSWFDTVNYALVSVSTLACSILLVVEPGALNVVSVIGQL